MTFLFAALILQDDFAAEFAKFGRKAPQGKCVSCHVGMDDPSMSAVKRGDDLQFRDWPTHLKSTELWPDAKTRGRMVRMLMAHPKPDVVAGPQSPHAKLSCETCHSAAFGEKHHDISLRPAAFMESICLKCHYGEEPLNAAAKLTRGKQVFERFACYACHKVPELDAVKRKPGPPLDHISSKVDKAWAANFVLHPPSFKPTARMPAFFPRPKMPAELFKDTPPEEQGGIARVAAACAVEYVFSLSTPLELFEIPAGVFETDRRRIGEQQRRGRGLVLDLGCLACHRIDENYPKGFQSKRGFLEEEFATNLLGSGDKFDSDLGRKWLYTWLKRPTHYFPDTSMPSLRLTNQEAADIVQFLVTLKIDNDSRKAAGFKPWQPADMAIDEKLLNELIAHRKGETKAPLKEKVLWYGREIVTVFGCYGCHTMPGEWAHKPMPQAEIKRSFVPRKDIPEHLPLLETSPKEHELASLYMLGEAEALDAPQDRKPLPKIKALAEGERIMAKFNCFGCHVVDEIKVWVHDEGRVHRVNAFYKTTVEKTAAFERPQWAVEWLRDPATLQVDPISKKYTHMFPEELVDRWEPSRGGLFQFRRLEYADYEEKALLAYRLPPPLRTAGRKLNPEWLKAFLASPYRMRVTRTRMPTFNYKEGEIDALVEYFRVRDGAKPEDKSAPMTMEEAERNYDRFQRAEQVLRSDCVRCHLIDGAGGNRGPEVTDSPRKLQRPWVQAVLQNPASIYPRTAMPDPPSGSDNEELVDLLMNYDAWRLLRIRKGGAQDLSQAVASGEPDIVKAALARLAKEPGLERALPAVLAVVLEKKLALREELEALLGHPSAQAKAAVVTALLRGGFRESMDVLAKQDRMALARGIHALHDASFLKRRVEPGTRTIAEWLTAVGASTEMKVEGSIEHRGATEALLTEISMKTGGVVVKVDGKLTLISIEAALRALLK